MVSHDCCNVCTCSDNPRNDRLDQRAGTKRQERDKGGKARRRVSRTNLQSFRVVSSQTGKKQLFTFILSWFLDSRHSLNLRPFFSINLSCNQATNLRTIDYFLYQLALRLNPPKKPTRFPTLIIADPVFIAYKMSYIPRPASCSLLGPSFPVFSRNSSRDEWEVLDSALTERRKIGRCRDK